MGWSLREFLNKAPWAGWVTAGIVFLAAAFLFFRGQRSDDPYNPDRMREMVTIRFTDTGEEITMPRGTMDKQLRHQGAHLDPSKGIINPKTGQATGFLFDKKEWDAMIARINNEKEQARKGSALSGAKPPEKK
jgi:hypothetical protein